MEHASDKVESLIGLRDDVSIIVFPEYVTGEQNPKVAINVEGCCHCHGC